MHVPCTCSASAVHVPCMCRACAVHVPCALTVRVYACAWYTRSNSHARTTHPRDVHLRTEETVQLEHQRHVTAAIGTAAARRCIHEVTARERPGAQLHVALGAQRCGRKCAWDEQASKPQVDLGAALSRRRLRSISVSSQSHLASLLQDPRPLCFMPSRGGAEVARPHLSRPQPSS